MLTDNMEYTEILIYNFRIHCIFHNAHLEFSFLPAHEPPPRLLFNP